jgi:hypothetical protein
MTQSSVAGWSDTVVLIWLALIAGNSGCEFYFNSAHRTVVPPTELRPTDLF